MPRGPGRALRYRLKHEGTDAAGNCICCAPPPATSKKAWKFDPASLKKPWAPPDDDGT